MKLNKSLVALVVLNGLTGCQLLTPSEPVERQIVSEWDNRPIIDNLEIMPAEQPVLTIADVDIPESVETGNEWFTDGFQSEFAASDNEEVTTEDDGKWSFLKSLSGFFATKTGVDAEQVVMEPKKAEVEHIFFDEHAEDKVEHSYIAQTSTYILEGTETHTFMAYEGESYRSVLSRWLNDQGYGVVGWYLDDLQQAMLNVPLTESKQMETTLDEAVAGLFDDVRNADVHFEGELVAKQEQLEAFIELRLDADAKQAVVTSKKMPTTVFSVLPGSLRDNFVRLGQHYGWNVKKDFYLATDYNVKFGFPIVSEEGNVKVGLEKLLASFSPLRGALVPSVREIYVVQEDR